MNTAVMIVAHPDDCVIFGWSFMHHHPRLAWSIVYLTYDADHERGAEFRRFWNQRRVPTTFLGFRDDFLDQERQALHHWNRVDAAGACWEAVRDADLVLTHSAQGDYGHIHHQVVYESVCQHPRLVTFAPPAQGTHHYELPLGLWQPQELPRHALIIQGFHVNTHRNSYDVGELTARWLEEQSCI